MSLYCENCNSKLQKSIQNDNLFCIKCSIPRLFEIPEIDPKIENSLYFTHLLVKDSKFHFLYGIFKEDFTIDSFWFNLTIYEVDKWYDDLDPKIVKTIITKYYKKQKLKEVPVEVLLTSPNKRIRDLLV